MTSKELRIGNLINYSENSTLFKVVAIDEIGVEVKSLKEQCWIETENFEGSELDEDWLIGFGFNKEPQTVSYAQVYTKKIVTDLETFNFTIIHVIGKYFCLQFYNNTKFLYVHELQNLFYTMNGFELEYR